jgi:hypothetical protein
MALRLKTLPTNATLAELQTAITQFEQNEFELICLSRGTVAGLASSTATFRRTPGKKPGPLSLKKVDGGLSLLEQETQADNGETPGKKLISYALLFVEEKETNVAVYRG